MHPAPARPVNDATFSALAGGVTLMQANFTDHAFERHSHDGFAIGMTTAGVQRFRCKGAQYDSQVGDFVLFNPDEDHDGSAGTGDGFRYAIWYVQDAFVASCVAPEGERADGRYFTRPCVIDHRMAAALARLSGSLPAMPAMPAESLRAETMLRAFLGSLLARHGERAGVPAPRAGAFAAEARMAQVRDYIRTYFQRDITVADLAVVAGMSRTHLTRAFGAAYQTPPHVYLNSVRVAHACTLIRGGMPLAAVALACGFADQSHLTRRFKGCVGLTPSGWRDRLRR